MNFRRNPTLTQRLAGEYVLGTLRGPARRRFETWMMEEAMVQRQVDEWQSRLLPLLHAAPPAAPPARVWRAVERRLFGTPATTWWDNARWWRWLAGATLACSVALVSWSTWRLQQPAALPAPIAILNNDHQQAGIVVSYDATRGTLQLAQLQPAALPAQRTMELWLIPPSNVPQSLGVVGNGRTISVQLTPAQQARLREATALALSLEPAGGSPTGAPTGPILWSGGLTQRS